MVSSSPRTMLLCSLAALSMSGATALAQGGGAGGIQTIPDVSKPERNTPSQPAGGLIDLRPKFRAGQTIRYVYQQTALNEVRGPDKDDETLNTDSELSQRIALVMRTTRADRDGTTIELVYESVRVTYKADGEEAVFDSSKPKTSPAATPSPGTAPASPGKPAPAAPSKTPSAPAQPAPAPIDPLAALDLDAMLETMLRPMVGSKVTVDLDGSGAITKVSGGQAPGGSFGSTGALPGGAGFMPDPKQLADWLVNGAAGSAGMVRVGQTWTNSDALGNTPVGPMRMRTTHTLRSAQSGVAQVAFTGGIEGGGTDAGAPMGVQLKDAGYSGNYQWDTREGALAGMQADMRVDMQGGANLLNLRMNSKTQVRVSRVDQQGLPRRD